MLNENTLNNLNIVGKNILKDETSNNMSNIFSYDQSNDQMNNYILNSNLSNEGLIK